MGCVALVCTPARSARTHRARITPIYRRADDLRAVRLAVVKHNDGSAAHQRFG
jgi:hypothetical protein